MGSREDDDYWNAKYDDVPHCEECGAELYWDETNEDYYCPEEGTDG